MADQVRTKIKPTRELYKLLHRDAEFVGSLERFARDVAQTAKAIAPRDSGDYAGSIKVDVEHDDGMSFVRVVAEDHKAHWIEFGTGGTSPTPAFAPLRKAARKSGLRIRSSAKARRLAKAQRVRKRGG